VIAVRSDDEAGRPEPEVQPEADLSTGKGDDGEMAGKDSFPASDPPAVWTRETPALTRTLGRSVATW
jgi:hypothetical protein